MLLRLASVTVLALFSLSPPPSQSDDLAALRREVQALKAQQQAMEKDLQAIKALLQSLVQPRAQGQPTGDQFVNKGIDLTDDPPRETRREVTLVECPTITVRSAGVRRCRSAEVMAEYVNTAK